MIKIAVVEDEKKWDDTFRNYIAEYGAKTKRVFEITSFPNGMEFISDYDGGFDLVLMDIAMPHMNGMEAAKRLRAVDGRVCLMFITTLAQYAVNGYDVNAFDFLVKPIEQELFNIKFARAVAHIESKAPKSFVINCAGGMRKMHVDEIKYIESVKHYLFFHTTDGELKMRASLDDVRAFFESNGFVAINRSLLVNLAFVDGYDNNQVTVGGEALPLSRVYRTAFLDKLATHLGGGYSL